MTTLTRSPDWFDAFWEEIKPRIPIYLRTDAFKKMARELSSTLSDYAIQEAAKKAATPQGVRVVIAFARVTAILKGAQGVCDSPDPTPEEVAAAVERLVQRVKP